MSDPPGTERPYRIDEAWSRAVHACRTGAVAAFLAPHLRGGMRLIDCGCGPGSITVDLAQAVEPGETIGIDVREEAVVQGRMLARQRGVSKIEFLVASIYQLPFADGSVDAVHVCGSAAPDCVARGPHGN